MEKKRQVSFAAKLLSNHYYLNEVSVEGKKSSRFNFNIAYYEHYAAQIIRAGNCISLLTTKFIITEDSFWNINYFEDLTKYVFWTFNKSFLLKVTDKIEGLTLTVLKRCQELLQENGTPYNNALSVSADEELEWCLVKNEIAFTS